MAYSFSVNNTPATGAVAMYLLISTLMTAGWTKVEDSDGTTYSAVGTQVTSGAAGANGLGNSSAWVRMAAPAVSGQIRELIIQRGTTNDRGWQIKYSASARFIGGAPAATVTPTATDEVYMIGAGTAATALASWFNTDATYRWHIACGGSAEFYSFYAFGVLIGATNYQNGLFLDVMAAGSFPSADVDPAVMFCSDTAASANAWGQQVTFGHLGGLISTTTNPAHARAWLGATSLAQASTTSNNQRIGLAPYGGTSGSIEGGTTTAGTNPFTSKDSLLPAWWIRPGASAVAVGVKGASTLFSFGSVIRTNLDTADTVGTMDKIYIGGPGTSSIAEQVWAPWSGVSPTI
jgi:hypothetical protein